VSDQANGNEIINIPFGATTKQLADFEGQRSRNHLKTSRRTAPTEDSAQEDEYQASNSLTANLEACAGLTSINVINVYAASCAV
jgi:hypothetical protein